jgi:hypothetical protein
MVASVDECRSLCVSMVGCSAVTISDRVGTLGKRECFTRKEVSVSECEVSEQWQDEHVYHTHLDALRIPPPAPPPLPALPQHPLTYRLNERFFERITPQTPPLKAGVLLHQGAQDPDAPWRPCSSDREHGLCVARRREGRMGKVSASLVFSGLHSTYSRLPLFSYDAGFVLAPAFADVSCVCASPHLYCYPHLSAH